MNNRRSRKGFTLIEMIVSITIISIIMLSVFFIYNNIIQANRRLELQRTLQENARSIMEGLANEVRSKGIDFSCYDPAVEPLDYTGSGNTFLAIKNGGACDSEKYCLTTDGSICNTTCQSDPQSCYLGRLNSNIALSDSSVVLKDLRFFISGNSSSGITSENDEAKVTIVYDIAIAEGRGISPTLINATTMHLQTTISEVYYKK